MKRLMTTPIFRDVDTVAERRAAARQTSELGPNEVVLWTGRPKRGIAFTGWDYVLIPFTFVWAGGAISIPFSSVGTAKSGALAVVIAFPIIGLYIALGRFLMDAWYRSKLRYVVTTERVILFSGFPLWANVMSIERSKLALRLTERPNGRGTVHLTPEDSWPGFTRWNQPPLHACLGHPPHLFRIKSARQVYELLRQPLT